MAISHEDYCRIIGQITLDYNLRIHSLETQLVNVTTAYKAEVERLREKITHMNNPPPPSTEGR